MGTQFEELKALGLSIEVLQKRVLKAYYNLLSHYIIKYRDNGNKVLIDDFQYARDMLSEALPKLAVVGPKLETIQEPDAHELVEFVTDLTEYLVQDVLDMTVLSLNAARSSVIEEEKEGQKVSSAAKIKDVLESISRYFSEQSLAATSAQVETCTALVDDLEKNTPK